jgi:phosphoenolpyruvate---glycerone phosphotransferase subunit DhaL
VDASPDTINCAVISRMLRGATGQIRQHHALLSQLDCAVGDGDHGTSMLRAMDAVAQAVAGYAGTDLGELLSTVAMAVMSCDGGSTGPLFGSFFMGMSGAAAGRTELDWAGFVGAFEAGVIRLQKQSRAQLGDKTMMDAFLPALAALKSAPPAAGVCLGLQQAAEAAARGAEATKPWRAKFGRARHLGDRAIGHADPGAVSVSLILKGFSDPGPFGDTV